MFNNSLKYYQQEIENDPDNHLAHFRLGRYYDDKSMVDDALVCYKKTI